MTQVYFSFSHFCISTFFFLSGKKSKSENRQLFMHLCPQKNKKTDICIQVCLITVLSGRLQNISYNVDVTVQPAWPQRRGRRNLIKSEESCSILYSLLFSSSAAPFPFLSLANPCPQSPGDNERSYNPRPHHCLFHVYSAPA